MWHLVVLSGFTFSIYLVYWAYRTWRDLRAEAADDTRVAKHPALEKFKTVNPWLNTLGLLAPVFISTIIILPPVVRFLLGTAVLIYLFSTLVLGIARLNPDTGSWSSRQPIACTGAIVGTHLLILATVHLPGVFYLVSLLSAIPFGFVQHWLNNYWKQVEPAEMPVRVAFSLMEMGLIILGAIAIGLPVAGYMIGVPN